MHAQPNALLRAFTLCRGELSARQETLDYFLWQDVHFIEVGGLTSFRCFTTSSWHPAQLRWKACWFVSVIMAVLLSCLICGISGHTSGFVPARVWQLWHVAPPSGFGSFARSSSVSVVVRPAGHAVLSGGVFTTSDAGCAVW